jgi:hypothetical protein
LQVEVVRHGLAREQIEQRRMARRVIRLRRIDRIHQPRKVDGSHYLDNAATPWLMRSEDWGIGGPPKFP